MLSFSMEWRKFVTIKPGLYIITKEAWWLAHEAKVGSLILVTEVTKDGSRVEYEYVLINNKNNSRHVSSFLDCGPVPATELMKELL